MLLAFAACLGLAGCGGGAKKIDAKALQKQAEEVESLATEGSLLAGDVAEGDTTSVFVRVHGDALGENAQKVLAKLAPDKAKPESGLAQKLDRASALARSVRADLAKLAESPSSQAAASLRGRLEHEAEEAKSLADSL
ncbi:hypothetical protein BH18ACT14_BH18ACT14_13010 [soil metagenome]